MLAKTLPIVVLAICVQAVTVAPSLANPLGKRPILSCLDQDGDGIGRDDVARFLSWRFDRLDGNQDGVITRSEFLASPEPRLTQREGLWRRVLWAWLRSGCALGGQQ